MALVEEIRFEGVQGMRVGRFTSQINTTCILYIFEGVLIDTGPPNQRKWVRKIVENLSVKLVLITHHHEDHAGNCGDVHRLTDAPVYAPEDGKKFLENGFPLQPYRRIIWGTPARFSPKIAPPRLDVSGRVEFVSVPAPGHSPDMTCFLEPNRGWLFTGDLFITRKPQFSRVDENPLQEIESLTKILRLDFQVVFCAHRGVVIEGKKALEDRLEYLQNLKNKCEQLYRQGYSIRQITRRLLGRENFMSFFTLGHFSKENLIRGLLQNQSPLDSSR